MNGGRNLALADDWMRRHPIAVDAVLAGVLAAVLPPSSTQFVMASDSTVAVKIAVRSGLFVAHASVAGRRAFPAAAYAICCAGMVGLVCTPPLTGVAVNDEPTDVPAVLLPSALVFAVLLYSIAAYANGRVPLFGLVVAGLGAVAAAVRMVVVEPVAIASPQGWPPVVVITGLLAAVVVVAWSLGRFRRLRANTVLEPRDRAQRAEADGASPWAPPRSRTGCAGVVRARRAVAVRKPSRRGPDGTSGRSPLAEITARDPDPGSGVATSWLSSLTDQEVCP